MLDVKCNKCSHRINFIEVSNASSHQKASSTFTTNHISNQPKLIVSVNLLDRTKLDFNIDAKSTVRDLFEKVCEYLDLKESDIFGLAQRTKNEYHFLSNDDKLSKYLTPIFKRSDTFNSSSSSLTNSSFSSQDDPISNNISSLSFISNQSSNINSLAHKFIDNLQSLSQRITVHSSNSYNFKNKKESACVARYQTLDHDFAPATTQKPVSTEICQCKASISVITLEFRVKFYVSEMLLLRNTKTRYLYYLQLRQNFLKINHKISEEKYFILASLALVVDFGAYDNKVHVGEYFDVKLYFPVWIINQLGAEYIYKNMPILHKQQSLHTSINAQGMFCSELSNEEYPFNLHLYHVFKTKDEMCGSIVLGIAPKGILVFNLRNFDEVSLISTFSWSSVSRINADKKKFEVVISIDNKFRRYTYFTQSEKFSKYLLDMSKLAHAFSVNIFERLADQKGMANYVAESYNKTIHSLNYNQIEEFQEREIIGVISPEVDAKDEIAAIDKLVEDLSYCSVSSSSSSCCEAPLGLNEHNESMNLTASSICKQESFLKNLINQDKQEPSGEEEESASNNSEHFLDNYENLFQLMPYSEIPTNISTNLPNQHINNSPQIKQPTINMAVDVSNHQFINDQNKFRFIFSNTNSFSPHPSHNSNALTYRQTFSAKTSSNSFSSINAHKPLKLKSRRSFLPPHSTINNNQNEDYFLLSEKKSSSSVRLSSANKIAQNEFKNNAFLKSDSFMSDSSSSTCDNEQSSLNFSNPPYIKYKKPPTYEESLKKIRKFSNNDSDLSCTNQINRLNGSESSYSSTSSHINSREITDLTAETNAYLKINSMNSSAVKDSDSDENLKSSYSGDESGSSSYNVGKKFEISIENLEQIRMKAASMSLPLLTALCSDRDIIQSLKSNQEESYF